MLLIINCYAIIVSIDYNCLPAFLVCMLHVLCPLTLIWMYLHVKVGISTFYQNLLLH